MATNIPFVKQFDFTYGIADELSPLVRRVIANNPGSFTYTGTGTYIVGRGSVAIIDPGPADGAHIDALLFAINGETISHILVTHTHLDHSPGCKLLQRHCNAETWSYGPHGYGRRNESLPGAASDPDFGADRDFVPDNKVVNGQLISGGAMTEHPWTLECIHTPGHAANHLGFCLQEENALFCGDAVMGWSTTIVSPPDGNMKDYMSTLDLLLGRNERCYYPTHGAPVSNPRPLVSALREHRVEREQQVLKCVADGLFTVAEMMPVVYAGLDTSLFPAAARSLFATIECLAEQGRLISASKISSDASYRLPS